MKIRAPILVVRARGFVEFKQVLSDKSQRLEIELVAASIEEEVVITATRTNTRLGEATASVAVVSREELETTAALRLDDALRQISGFQLFRRAGSRTANPTTQGVSLRGVGASGASRAIVFADGIPLNDPFGGWVYWNRVPRESVDQVEVLRGGASHLYGGGALGGVVHVITRRVTPRPAVLSAELSYGNQDTGSASLFAGVSRKEWKLSMGAEISNTDGYVIVAGDERGRVDTPAGSRYSSINVELERETVRLGRFFLRGEVFGESRRNGTPLQINRTHIRRLSAGIDRQTTNAGSFSFRMFGGNQVFDQTFSAVSIDRNSETLTRVQRVPAQSAGVSGQWSGAVGANNTVVAGVEAREQRGSSDELAFVQNRPTFFTGAGGRERNVGLFVEDFFRPNQSVSFAVGARVDHWREFSALSATRPVGNTQPATRVNFPDRSETAISPHLSVLVAPWKRVSFTAAFTGAFRPPTLNELYRSFRVGDVVTLANENLKAEKLAGAEVGARFSFLDGRFSSRVTAFSTKVTKPVANVTIEVMPTQITRQRQNLGSTRSRGIEIESEARLSERWILSAGYLFVNSTVRDFPANRALRGLRVPQIPQHQGSIQMQFRDPDWAIGVQGRGGSEQFDDDQNALPLKPYFSLDGFASRRLSKEIEVFVAGENLLNRRYETGRTPVTTVGPPLLLRAGIRFRLR